MKKYQYILLALIIIFFVILGFVLYNYFKNQELNNPLVNDKGDSEPDKLKTNLSDSNEINSGDLDNPIPEQVAGGSGESSANNQINTRPLPSDIDSRECGFYYGDYGVCTGKCPEGKCISEGRSCYCKNI